MPRLSLLGCKEWPGKGRGPSLQRGWNEHRQVTSRCAEPVRRGRARAGAGSGHTWAHTCRGLGRPELPETSVWGA